MLRLLLLLAAPAVASLVASFPTSCLLCTMILYLLKWVIGKLVLLWLWLLRRCSSNDSTSTAKLRGTVAEFAYNAAKTVLQPL